MVIELGIGLIVLAVTIEGIGEYVHTLVDYHTTRDIQKLVIQMGVLLLSIFLCTMVTENIGIYSAFGIHFRWPILDSILTGVVVSRGANYIADIFNRINEHWTGKK